MSLNPRIPRATERLDLHPVCEDHTEAFAGFYGDAAVMGIRRYGVQDRDGAMALLANVLEHWQRRDFGMWAAFERASGEFIGEIGLRERDDGDGEHANEVVLSYGLFPAYWGKGYATEGGRKAIAYGFHCLGLEEIGALARADNISSHRVMEKLGMRWRENLTVGEHGRRVELVRYTIAASDYLDGGIASALAVRLD